MSIFNFGNNRKKYKLVESHSPEFKTSDGWRQLQAVKSFGNVSQGDLGGYVKNTTLSHKGLCWIGDDCACEGCVITDNAQVTYKSYLKGVTMTGNTKVVNSAIISEEYRNILISDNAEIKYCNTMYSTGDYKCTIKDNTRILHVRTMRMDGVILAGDTCIDEDDSHPKYMELLDKLETKALLGNITPAGVRTTKMRRVEPVVEEAI